MENQPNLSTMTSEQALAMQSIFATSILNEISGGMGREVKHLKITMNLIKGKSVVYINEVEEINNKLASIDSFNETLKPAVYEEANKRLMVSVDGFLLEVSNEKFVLEVYGKNSENILGSFIIQPVDLIIYANKPKKSDNLKKLE